MRSDAAGGRGLARRGASTRLAATLPAHRKRTLNKKPKNPINATLDTPDHPKDPRELYAPLPDRDKAASFAAVYRVYDDDAWLTDSVESIYAASDKAA